MNDLLRDVPGAGLDIGFVGAFASAAGSAPRSAAAWLAQRSHRVHGFGPDLELEPAGSEPASGVLPMRAERVDAVELRLIQPVTLDWQAARAIDPAVLAWLAETPCDVVHVFDLCGLGPGALQAISDVGQPLVATLHEAWPRSPEIASALRHCQRIFAEGSVREEFSALGLDERLFAELPGEVELERVYVEIIREETGLEPDLVHPIDESSGPSAARPAAPGAGPEPPPGKRGGLFGRLFGR